MATTNDHPFWNASENKWQPAEQLEIGESLVTNKGTPVVVQGLSVSVGTQAAYNLTVANFHTYYVLAGNTPVLVHNTCGVDFISKGAGVNLRRSAEINGEKWHFNTGHGFNRAHHGPDGTMNDLRTTTLTPDQVEGAIAGHVNAYRGSSQLGV
ncbi:HINT domain-containing protein [Micromonospora sp. NBC_01405]|uniref:polymorphic toxin-type HINT domain-containing protein n=1 Tax=Micromonospora sp. NBC_01405 TaxID=2903589 RepID=UPI00324A23DE